MNDNQNGVNQPQNQTGIPVPVAPPVGATPPASKIPSLSQMKNSIKPLLKNVFGKLYENKKMFYLVMSLLGLIVLIIVAGVIYKMSRNLSSRSKVTLTPPPVAETITTNENLTPLEKMENDLKATKVKIDALDVKQLPLTPQIIDYKIKF